MSLHLSTEDFYRHFPERAVPADVHRILMRVASLTDTLSGKVKVWSEPGQRPSKRIKDLADIPEDPLPFHRGPDAVCHPKHKAAPLGNTYLWLDRGGAGGGLAGLLG